MFIAPGPKYWKSSSRRIRAIPESDYNKFVGGVGYGFVDDDDFIHAGKGKGKAPSTKKYRSGSPESSSPPGPSTCTSLEAIVKRLDDLEKRHSDDELVKAKATINRMQIELSKVSGKLETIADNLKCIICRNFLSSDSVVLPCCGNFGCCRPCISPWLIDNATCPHCRAALTMMDITPFPCTKQIPSIIEILQQVEEVIELN